MTVLALEDEHPTAEQLGAAAGGPIAFPNYFAHLPSRSYAAQMP
ncbi:hypothetical protein ACW9KT_06820 [Hymenobacter sp. HD11105]